jgi:hypothetical protein
MGAFLTRIATLSLRLIRAAFSVQRSSKDAGRIAWIVKLELSRHHEKVQNARPTTLGA